MFDYVPRSDFGIYDQRLPNLCQWYEGVYLEVRRRHNIVSDLDFAKRFGGNDPKECSASQQRLSVNLRLAGQIELAARPHSGDRRAGAEALEGILGPQRSLTALLKSTAQPRRRSHPAQVTAAAPRHEVPPPPPRLWSPLLR